MKISMLICRSGDNKINFNPSGICSPGYLKASLNNFVKDRTAIRDRQDQASSNSNLSLSVCPIDYC